MSSRLVVGFALAWLMVAAAGCSSPAVDAGGDDDQQTPPTDDCELDTDCVAVAASCCECPTFALPADDTRSDACNDVECQDPVSCAATEVACLAHVCELRCTAVACGVVCDGGFKTDARGCLECECSTDRPPDGGCAVDADCVRVPADCCGCELGGQDTALPASEAAAYLDGLELSCGEDAACPGVDACDPSQVPRCLGGACTLGAAIGGPGVPDAGTGPMSGDVRCGTSDLPPCPDGYVCVLNDPESDDASEAGVGVCRPLP